MMGKDLKKLDGPSAKSAERVREETQERQPVVSPVRTRTDAQWLETLQPLTPALAARLILRELSYLRGGAREAHLAGALGAFQEVRNDQ